MPMKLAEVPHSKVVLTARNPNEIAAALAGILGSNELHFFGYDIIEGAPCSGRIIFSTPGQQGVPFPQAMVAAEVAQEIFGYTKQARYADPEHSGMQKGWEVRATRVRNNPAAIVFAAWCQ